MAPDRSALVLAARALESNGTAAEAASAARQALEIDPLDTEALRVAADAAIALNRFDAAIETLERLVYARRGQGGGDASPCADLALLLLARGERPASAAAIALLREAALLDPGRVAALRTAGSFSGLVDDAALDAILAPYRR
jgi:tetratricopeptide (TPR) repeat protein